MPKSEFLREAEARGFIFQCTDMEALDAAMQAGPVAGYIGFDPTADSLHVGSLIQIMMLRLLQKHGHRPVALLGGGTARIGDPSFREEARQLMTAETIAHNLHGIEGCLRQFLSFDSTGGAMLANNADWLDRLSYIDLLRDVGVHFSVNRMLSFDSVRSRLEREQGLTFLEFNYSILQSYDFRELNARHGVTLQMGGSDQWGNIVSGIDLVRRMNQQQVFGLTTPLLTTSSGAKMGKSARGAVWLSAARLPVFEYWQFWRNTEDADVGRFLRLFTDLPIEECDRLAALPGAGINEAKKVLATEATALCHGRAAAQEAAEAARRTFEEGALSADALPTITLPAATLREGIAAFRLLADSGLVASNGEARRLIRGGGARLNDEVIADEGRVIGEGDLHDGVLKLSSGRKKHILVRPA
ncbi:tyrosine--tRNA ligase [Novacetimonas pomaceti]|uniref:Tyrosine--tRNA ligase n=1 Tax=Novacetimonas pomaceti TaxID=2021998 RepID=A0A318QEC0_9PROT|nr:tyrosine--tRNA ligase [Novacetimonas pomaceti]MBV1832679.1 tyrosine--tRNA ligase [Novacetimonas pomaceti]PYD49056.1 tyrosine--tRNA ligase [Novacetimonas pomaceti]PYD75718.1 tyrosine--tRNA ligase [Novacetimonas pomaceti]